MSIECGARGGMIAPDQTTFDYVKGRQFAPKGEDWDKALAYWKTLKSDVGVSYDTVYTYDAADIEPMITFGTNPGMGIGITHNIPNSNKLSGSDKLTYEKSLKYMGYSEGDQMVGKQIDYVFVGSCTNGRIEDFRNFAAFVKGKQKAANVTAWIVPGSRAVEKQIIAEGLVEILEAAGFELRQPGCSACLAMNDDKIPEVLIGDPVRLHQIILNLVSNAVKFTNNGKIIVSARLLNEDEDNVTIEFSVKDTGIGISEAKIAKVFENFQQASSGTSRLYGGTGLGLAICKQLVEAQGGIISVKSKIDVGSTFGFIFKFPENAVGS